MGLSSAGIGSGIQVEEIVAKLVSLEKQPLVKLQSVASSMKTQLSVYSQVKSLVSTLSDAAGKLAKSSSWSSVTATSANNAAVSVQVTGAASATAFEVQVQQLARGQSVASASLGVAGTPVGAGTLSIQLGAWSQPVPSGFTGGATAAVDITVDATDSLNDVAAKINGAKAGVSATVLRDAQGERLLLRSSTTGEASGFRIDVSEGTPAGLARLKFNPQADPGAGMAANSVQYGQNAQATLNGIALQSATNTFADTIPGLAFTVAQTTTAPVEIAVQSDTAALKKNIQDFVTAYNAVNDLLTAATKYDADTKTAGALQGDSTTVGLQGMLRSAMGSTTAGAGVYQRLADIGIDIKKGGKLEVSESKLDIALKDPQALEAMFSANTSTAPDANGLAAKVKAQLDQLLSFQGTIGNKTEAINASVKRNLADQDRVNDRAARTEKKLRAQYLALDVRMASLSGLSAYMSQQVSQWNNTES